MLTRRQTGFNSGTFAWISLPPQQTPHYNDPLMRRRASLHTLGCRLNQSETSVLEFRLRRDGYDIVDFGEPTDLLVVNTCSVTEEAERTCRYVIRKTLHHSPRAFVAVTGCYAQTGQQQLRKIPGIDLIVGNQFKWELPSFLPTPQTLKKQAAPEVIHTTMIDREDFVLPDFAEPDSTRALLKIQDGCNVMCSFCLIPFARGRERSRILGDVLREAETLAARGYREVVLTGVNLGQYHHSGVNLLGLVDRLETIQGLERIRISSIEPTTVTEALLRRIASSSKVCPHLHIPMQSGDDSILSSMNRPYTVAEFTTIVERTVSMIPHVGLGTDIMVGFPGESDGAFERTVRLAQRLPFDYFHVFTYSKRPQTTAARLPLQVPTAVARNRAKILSVLSREKRIAFAERSIGSTIPVLFESGITQGFRIGTTAHFLKVGIPADTDLTNQIRPVQITGASERWAVGRLLLDGRPVHKHVLL